MAVLTKKIDIIIPLYNQRKYLARCLGSIMVQSMAQICNVTIIDDASTEDYTDILQFYKPYLAIDYIRIGDNRGPGYARQLGLNVTSLPYVMFVDADDVLENIFAVEYLYGKILSKGKPCAVFASFVEECRGGRKEIHTKDSTWIFGKLYLREFLQRNNIKFPDSRQNEDKGFNTQVILCAQKQGEQPIIFDEKVVYSWSWNGDSITRKDNFSYIKEDLFGFVDNVIFAIRNAEQQNTTLTAIKRQANATMIYLYFRYLENRQTHDYSDKDIGGLLGKFYSQAYKQYRYDITKPEESKLFEQKYLQIQNDFIKRGIYDTQDEQEHNIFQVLSLLD